MSIERESIEFDVLFVGGGPASLAGAIKLMQLAKEKGKELEVALIEKGAEIGSHALSGAVMASGLFLGNGRPYRHRRVLRESARQLHDAFKRSNGATCCRVLTQAVQHDKKARFQQCADLTAQAAELAARLILEKRPERMARVDLAFLSKGQSRIGGPLLRLFHLLSN